jgi:hypothetical protein
VRTRPDIPALVAGLVVLALGAVLLLNAADTIDLGLEAFAPIACAALGTILLATGLGRGR